MQSPYFVAPLDHVQVDNTVRFIGVERLRASGVPPEHLARWLDGMNSAILTAMRSLAEIEAWTGRPENVMAQLSGRTPVALRRVFTESPLASAPMAEAITGASRAAVKRNLAWMEANGLNRKVTKQGRYRIWTAAQQAADL